jgi:hypothetical protein
MFSRGLLLVQEITAPTALEGVMGTQLQPAAASPGAAPLAIAAQGEEVQVEALSLLPSHSLPLSLSRRKMWKGERRALTWMPQTPSCNQLLLLLPLSLSLSLKRQQI